jgi:hypothetical protein
MPTDTATTIDRIDAEFAELVELVRLAKANENPACRQAHLIAVEYAVRELGLPQLMKTVLRLAEREADKQPIRRAAAAVQESMDRRSA